jgi:hypothetical protein
LRPVQSLTTQVPLVVSVPVLTEALVEVVAF